jgi:hypothetical protein
LLNVRSSRAWPASAIFRGVLPTLCEVAPDRDHRLRDDAAREAAVRLQCALGFSVLPEAVAPHRRAVIGEEARFGVGDQALQARFREAAPRGCAAAFLRLD